MRKAHSSPESIRTETANSYSAKRGSTNKRGSTKMKTRVCLATFWVAVFSQAKTRSVLMRALESIVASIYSCMAPVAKMEIPVKCSWVAALFLIIGLPSGRADQTIVVRSGNGSINAQDTQEASDLAHNDPQYAAAVNPVLSDLLGTDRKCKV